MNAEVKIPLSELDELRQSITNAENRAAELEAKLAEAELADPAGRVQPLVDAIKAAMPLIQFAVANLDPTITVGWPYAELETFAEVLDVMPGVDKLTKEYALEFKNFAREVRRVESGRQRRPPIDIVELLRQEDGA